MLNQMPIPTFELEELIMHVLGIDPNADNYEDLIEEGLYEDYGIEDPSAIYQFLRQIIPLIDKSQGGMNGTEYKGFAIVLSDQGDGIVRKKWLVKIPV